MTAPIVDKVLRDTMIETGVLDLPTFFNAVRHNEIKTVQHRMQGVDMQTMGGPNIWDEHGQYPIHVAAAEGHTKMVRLIIEMQGDVNQMTHNEHRTALHYAVINKSHDAIRYLVDVGAKTDIKDVFHRTPRMYAVDEEMMRIVFEGECINKNLSDLSDCIERLMKMNNIKIRKPRSEEAQRVCLGYEMFAHEMEEVNAREDMTLPVPPTPGPNLIKEQVGKMRKRNHGHDAYLVVAPREEFSSNNSRPFSSFIKITYTEYFRGELAVSIDDIYVSKNNRRHYWGSILLASALSYVVVGPHPPPKRIFKVFACVNEANHLANGFFKNAGFVQQPPAAIPPRLRQLGTIVYAAKHAGLLLSKITKALKPGLSFASDWVTTAKLKAQEDAARKAVEDRDQKVFNKRLDAIFAEADVPRMTSLLANIAGEVVLPLGVAEPPDPQREAERARVMRIVEKKHASYAQQGAKSKKKEPKNTCENDRVPDDILKANGAAVLRMRDLHRWKHEIEGRKVGNSKILACPDILRDCWLDELEYDAKLALPDEWVRRKDRGTGEYIYYNKNTRTSTTTRPQQNVILELRAAGEDSIAIKEEEEAFGELVGEKQKEAEEAEKKRIKDRRLWEREMDEIIDKALGRSESIESFIKRMEIYYPKEKANEIILKAKQALTAKTKVEGADLNVAQAIGKRGLFQGAKDLFKTPLEKSKDVKAAVQAHCAKEMSKKMADEQCDLDASAHNTDRPSSSMVSAAAFGTPQRRVRAVFEAPSPSDLAAPLRPGGELKQKVGNNDDEETGTVEVKRDAKRMASPSGHLVTPNRRQKLQEKKGHSSPIKQSPLMGHCCDAAADWIQSAADQEQALHDADSMLEMYAPPTRSSACAERSHNNEENLDSNTCHAVEQGAVEVAVKQQPHGVDAERGRAKGQNSDRKELGAWGDLSTVIESPDARRSAGFFFGHDDQDHPLEAHLFEQGRKPMGSEACIVPFASGRDEVLATRPSTGMSLASTALQSRGASRGTATGMSQGGSIFGLDGISRPSSIQDGPGFGLDGIYRPSSVGFVENSKSLNLSSSCGYVPWGSHMLTQEGEASMRFSSVASDGSAFREGRISASSTPATSIYGLDGASRPISRADSSPVSREASPRADSRPVSREAGSHRCRNDRARPVSGSWRPEWSVPWRMGAAGRGGRETDKQARGGSACASICSIGPGAPSRTISPVNDRRVSSTYSGHETTSIESGVGSASAAAREASASRELPCHPMQATKQPASDSCHLPSICAGVWGRVEAEALRSRACEPGSHWRPKTAALKPKTLQFAQDCPSRLPRPHSGAVSSPTKCPGGAPHSL